MNKSFILVEKRIKINFAFEQLSALLIISCILFVAELGLFKTSASAETGKTISRILAANAIIEEGSIEEKNNSEEPLSFEKFETKGLIFADLAPVEQENNKESNEEEPLVLVQESALISLSNGNDPQDFSERGEPFKYIVKAGDTPSTIAQLFGISTNTVLWANSLGYWDYIKPGDELLILPVSGLQHKVKSGESIQSIAQKYKADSEEIIAFNMLSADGTIKAGQVLMIPNGEIKIPQTSPSQTSYASVSSSRKNILQYQGNSHHFPYGYCTYYVATRYPIPWGGHAKSWLSNARAYGYATGSVPEKGAIVVTTESWWGHVAIVEAVSATHITVSEMNHIGWGKKSVRQIPRNSRVIRGYIYIK